MFISLLFPFFFSVINHSLSSNLRAQTMQITKNNPIKDQSKSPANSINKEELVRLMLQSLQDLGYQ